MADEAPQTNGNGEPPKIRLNLGSFNKPKTGPKDAPMPVKAPGKTETTRIDLSKAVPPSHDTQKVDPAAASKMTTMRVEIVEPQQQRKAETTRIDLAAAATPKQTGRIDLGKEAGGEDLFKRNTIAVGVPTPPPAAKPKTIQVKKPVAKPNESLITPATPTPEAVIEAKKSETARIDLPPESADRPATRPKTIRIKRPDGTTGRKSLTIARPAGEEVSVAATITPGFAAAEEEGAGTVFSILALVALVVACVVVYVLAAQTIAPTLPWPGRLV